MGGGVLARQPPGPAATCCSFADVSLHRALTLLAGDVAAPVIFAVAAFNQFLCVGVVSTIAAHHVAAVAARRRLVALSAKSMFQASR